MFASCKVNTHNGTSETLRGSRSQVEGALVQRKSRGIRSPALCLFVVLPVSLAAASCLFSSIDIAVSGQRPSQNVSMARGLECVCVPAQASLPTTFASTTSVVRVCSRYSRSAYQPRHACASWHLFPGPAVSSACVLCFIALPALDADPASRGFSVCWHRMMTTGIAR